MAGGNREPGRSVTSKVLAVLEAFEATTHALTLAEISSRSGLPSSTAHRLIGELTIWGMLERTTSGRYQIGIRLWEIAQGAGRQLREAARPWLQDLAAVTNRSVTISVRSGRDSLLVERAHGDHRVARMSKVGSRLPLHASASGKILLAFEEEWMRRTYLKVELRAVTSDTHVDPALLERELSIALEDGFAQSVGEVRVGASSIAVPVFHSGRIAASIGIVAGAERAIYLKQYLPAMRATATNIEEAIRYLPRESLLGAQVAGEASE